MGDPKTFRDPDRLRSDLLSHGDRDSIAAELAAIAHGPKKAERRDFAVYLSRLSLHFWRPEFTPDQAKLLFEDFAQDLDGVTPDELRNACIEWRQDPLNRFFPTPGQLRELVAQKLRDRSRIRDGVARLLELIPKEPGTEPPVRTMLKDLADKMRVNHA